MTKRSQLPVILILISFILVGTNTLAAEDQPVLVSIKRMSLDTVLKMGKAAIDMCRKKGVQVAVTIIDRGGHPQLILRDTLAMDLSLEISRQKAYTAMTFNNATSKMTGRFTDPFSVGKVNGVLVAAGGLPITASGTIIGGIGVSGAPSGETDESCAQAGIDAVADDMEMSAM